MTETPAQESPPSRIMAALLGLLGPWGIGQYYLGQTRRAVLWLVVPSVTALVWAASLPWVGAVFGYGVVVGIGLPAIALAWPASLMDLWFVPGERFARVSRLRVFAFWTLGFVVAIALPLSIRMFILEAFKTPSGAMAPTLMVGDHLFTDKLVLRARPPKRGEAIIFEFPENPEQNFAKRVIATPGDKLIVKSGHPWINGWEVPYCLIGKGTMAAEDRTISGEVDMEYLDGQAYLIFLDEHVPSPEAQGPYTVARDEVYVLGDNRNSSYDSRSWFQGRGAGVPRSMVVARVLFRWLSFVDGVTDWSRFGTRVSIPLLPRSLRSLEAGLEECLEQRPPIDKTMPPRR
jgi:signal peptidase I